VTALVEQFDLHRLLADLGLQATLLVESCLLLVRIRSAFQARLGANKESVAPFGELGGSLLRLA
jgi:hypothetical protein